MAESKKNKFLVDEGIAAGAAVGAAVGTRKLLLDSKLDHFDKENKKIKGRIKPKPGEINAFIKSLKPGDVLLNGDYNPKGLTGRMYDTILGGKDGYWHAAVHSGRGRLIEVGNKEYTTNQDSIRRRLEKGERMKAMRPTFSRNSAKNEQEIQGFLKKLKNKPKDALYSEVGAVTSFVRNKLNIKGRAGNCKGTFCSNFISKELPEASKKVMRVNPDIAMPYDFEKHPHFKPVAEINLARTEKIFSKARLLRNVSKPLAAGVAVGGMLGAAATLLGNKK